MKGLLTYKNLIFLLFFVGSFLFFEVNYRYWYRFMEQYSLFLNTDAYFSDLLKQVGGFNEYLTTFITQFFVLPFVPSVTIALLLTLISIVFAAYLHKIFQFSTLNFQLLILLPAFLFWLFPVESIASILAVLTGLAAVLGYASIKKPLVRYVAGVLLITVTYLLSAPAYLPAALLMTIYECCTTTKKGSGYTVSLGLLAWALVLPLVAMRTCYVIPMREAYFSRHLFHPEYALPASFWYIGCSFPMLSIGVWLLRNCRPLFRNEKLGRIASVSFLTVVTVCIIYFGKHPLEQVYHYDWLARNQQWDIICEHVDKHPVKDKDALVYANLAYAHTGRFNEALLRLPQIGDEGFIPHDPVTRLGLIEASEVAWLLNHTNSAQRFAFVGVLSSQRNVQPRLMKRLVETYLVNEEYKAAEKYMRILEKTTFYKAGVSKWYKLLNPETAAATPWIAEKRSLNPVTDNPYDLTKTLPDALAFLIDDHSDNKTAFEYGMGYLLLYKNLGAFIHYMEQLKETGQPLSVLYQEAICLYYNAVENNPEVFHSYPISSAVYSRFSGYLQQVRTLSPALLAQQYGDTYYYYAQFVQPPKMPSR
ncbi:hypothetical protein FACS189416_0150 [Bacteroidia bacterium]|nr:hypothetical protein FACS189416_0150 [Bacteroidia bacterium]